MKKTTLVWLLAFAFLMLPCSAVAEITIGIDIADAFGVGEQITFGYTLTSSEDADVGYVPGVDCPGTIDPIMDYRAATLKKGTKVTGTYDYGEVTADLEPQACTAYVQVMSPVQQLAETEFEIISLPSIEFEPLTCMDAACGEKTRVFAIGEEIYLGYDSGVSGVEVVATLAMPDGTVQMLTLPAALTAQLTGTYALEATASKAGYKKTAKSIQFGVIEQEPHITYWVEAACGNSVCETGETAENCHEDCAAAAHEPTALEQNAHYIALACILTALGAAAIYIRRQSQTLPNKKHI